MSNSKYETKHGSCTALGGGVYHLQEEAYLSSDIEHISDEYETYLARVIDDKGRTYEAMWLMPKNIEDGSDLDWGYASTVKLLD